MKERGVGEHAIEEVVRQVEFQKILLPDLATAVLARHGRETRGAFETDGGVPEIDERLQVAPGSATEIEYRERRVAFDGLQQRRDVLSYVVVARAFPEIFGTLVIFVQRDAGDFCKTLRS